MVIIMTATLFTGCKKEKSDPECYLQTGDTRYILTGGNLAYKGSSSTKTTIYYRFIVSTATEGITLGYDAGGIPTFTGNGAGLVLNLYSSTAEKPAQGEYPLATFSAAGNQLNGAGYAITQTGTPVVFREFETANTEIKADGDTYTITSEGTDEYGVAFTLFYSGKLNFTDMSDDM